MAEWSVICADVLEGLRAIRPGSVQTVVTSPPYYGLRDYKLPPTTWPDGWVGCLGLEPTPELFLDHLVEVFRGVREVVRDDGTIWVNMGDSYVGSRRGPEGSLSTLDGTRHSQRESRAPTLPDRKATRELPNGNKLGIPERLATRLQEDGWIWRSTVVWSKNNPMPESIRGWRWEKCRVKVEEASRQGSRRDCPRGPSRTKRVSIPGNGGQGFDATAWKPCLGCPKCEPNDGLVLRRGSWRPTTAHEYLYLFTKSATYYGDGEAIREAASPNTHSRGAGVNPKATKGRQGEDRQNASWSGAVAGVVRSRNLRSVWQVPTQPFPGAHFATFPEALAERCILATTPEKSCGECGAPWAPVVEVAYANPGNRTTNGPRSTERRAETAGFEQRLERHSRVLAQRVTCTCEAEPVAPIVLDQFSGSGTAGLVAIKNGRRYLGIERSPTYCQMSRKRIGEACTDYVQENGGKAAQITGPLFEGFEGVV